MPPPPTTAPRSRTGFSEVVHKLWELELRLFSPFMESFLPKPHYLDGESVQQVIRMAEYRIKTSQIMGVVGLFLFIPALVVLLLMWWLGSETGEMISGAMAVVGLLFLAQSLIGWLSYQQWQFIVTDKRYILVTPDPDRQGFADAIYLKRGKIQVLDTNFSHSPLWGVFQILTGSRDVMLSMGGYEFYETGAKVKGGLRFPDVVPEDIRQLETLIFG